MWKRVLLMAAMVCGIGESLRADILILGRINNGTPDTISFAPTRNLAANETFYFTDNGWTGSGFRGATATNGDGNENLLRFTTVNAISAGTLIVSNTTSANYTFLSAGSIPGTTAGSFANLSLAQSGDQIYAFTGVTNNPLFNATAANILFTLDDTSGFEAATDTATGLRGGALGISLNPTTQAGGLALINDGATRTRAEWENYATNSANWASGASLTLESTGNLNITAVPEPTSIALVSLAGCTWLFAAYRRRKARSTIA